MIAGANTVPLGELCDVLDSQRKPITKRDRKSGEYPYYGATGVLDYVEDYIFDEPLILIGEDGAKWGAGENTSFLVEGKYWVNNHAHVIRPHRDKVSDRWIIYYLNATDLSKFITGLTVPKLNQGKLREIPIPLPPLPQQKRIVTILDSAFESIERAASLATRNAENAKELFEALLDDRISLALQAAETISLGKLCEPRTITYGVIKLGQHVSHGIPCLRTSNVRRLHIDRQAMKHIEPSLSEEYGRTILKGGEVLVNVRGTLGGVAVVEKDMAGWNVSREVAVVPADVDKIDPHYLAYSIATKSNQEWLTGVLKGVAYTGINLTDLRELPVAVPPLKEQSRIVAELNQAWQDCRILAANYERRQHLVGQLRQSVLNDAFSGELTADHAQNIAKEAVA